MTLTPEQKAEGWIPLQKGTPWPLSDKKTVFDVLLSDGGKISALSGDDWRCFNRAWVIAYRIIEAHGADAAPARPTPASHSLCATSSCALRESLEMLPALWRSREPGDRTEFDAGYEQASGECADVLEQTLALSPVRPTPWPHDYSELVWDADGWSQTIIVDGKRPEWLRDDDVTTALPFGGKNGRWTAEDRTWSLSIAIRVRRREPKRETQRACLRYQTDRPFDTDLYVTIDLIDGQPDLSTLKIAEDAL